MKRIKLSEDVRVELGDSRSYPIAFSPISSLADALEDYGFAKGKCVLISNDVVGKTKHRQLAFDSLKNAGWVVSYVEFPDGEYQKTPETYMMVVNKLLEQKVDRKTLVIGLGGGVTTDIVGFAAATVLRGLKFVNIPTSLLAMVDASVGGKTGVNTTHGKNLLGAFWQPSLVLVSIEALETLSDFEYSCGMGEVVKHAVLEESGDFFRWLVKESAALSNRKGGEAHVNAVTIAVRRCCEIKAAVVGEDEREDGKRALLNLGHTVGHAIEHVLGFGNVAHGVAVAIGTVAEARLAEIRGDAKPGLAKEIADLLDKLNLPFYLEHPDIDALVDAVFMDKKREGAKITITVPKSIGDVALVKVDPSELRKAFETLSSSKALLD